MAEGLVSVIVVSVGINNYLRSCLKSLESQTYPQLEILVIDNSLSQNVSQEVFRYPEIKLYSQEKKLSYCLSLNKGIEISKGDFTLCLNDDVLLDKNFIKEALRGFSIDEKIGMVSGKILRFDKRTIDSAGLFLSPWRAPKERGYGTKDSGKFEKEEYIFGVNGAVALYRKEMLESIKMDSEYFDSDFKFFYEDLDIAWRAQNFGWRCYYIPKAIAYHLRGGSLRQSKGVGNKYARHYLSDDLHFDLIKNRYLCIIKNEKFVNFLLHLPFIVLYDLVVLIYIIIFKPSLIKKIFLAPIPISSAFKKRKLLPS